MDTQTVATYGAYPRLQSWINGSVIVETKTGTFHGILLSADYDGVITQGTIVNHDLDKRLADTFIPWHRVESISFTADATEPRPSTFPAYTPGQDNWTGER